MTRTIRLNFSSVPMRRYADDLFMAQFSIADVKTSIRFAYAIWALSYLGTGVIVKIK